MENLQALKSALLEARKAYTTHPSASSETTVEQDIEEKRLEAALTAASCAYNEALKQHIQAA